MAALLGGLAAPRHDQRSILVVLDDEDSYYAYVSAGYPDGGEYGLSGGMFIDAGCPHFVTRRDDLALIEPVIAHELTHAALAHLRLPLWLDEGIAVNTERRLAPTAAGVHTPAQMHARHQAFWNGETIQQFWSGNAFARPDDGQMLSCDLARILVQHLSVDWAAFEAFAAHAERADAGHGAARRHLEVDLAAWVCALLERPTDPAWAPQPAAPGRPA